MDRLFFLMVMVLLYSCSAGMADMDATDYVRWYKQNEELTRTRKYEEVNFAATYKTPELIYLMENSSGDISVTGFEKRKQELGQLKYFNLKITGEKNRDLFSEYGLNDVNYPIDLMQKDFYLVQESDTLSCVLFHFERNYGLSPMTDISLAFDQVPDPKKGFTLVYNDELFRTGLNKFRFEASAIHAIPKLRLR